MDRMKRILALLALLALSAFPAEAVNCKAACAAQIRKCIKKCCSPPEFGPVKACKIGIRGAALYACKQSGKQACPRKACIIDDC